MHGSGLFTRGQTQTLATVTLGPALEATPQRWEHAPVALLETKIAMIFKKMILFCEIQIIFWT